MRAVFCGGGTGGHVYPALCVASALKRLASPKLDVLYIGVRGKIDAEIVAREGIPFTAVTAAPLRSGSVPASVRGGLKVLAGIAQAYSILGSFRPDAVFATGGYGSVGVGFAARLRNLPLLLFLPDVTAGLAVKALSRVASRIAVAVPPAQASMPRSRTVLTGYPVRGAFFEAQRDDARRRLGLDQDLPTLLVTGGSTGASVINRAVAGWIPDFLRSGQIVHISGYIDEPWLREQRAKLAPDLRSRYHLHAYLHDDMAQALAAADLAIMRAGASTLGELPAAGLPAVLVPGDFSDQLENARFLEQQGGAVMLPESRVGDLQPVVTDLLADEGRRHRMREALACLARPGADERLARLLLEIAGVKEPAAA